MRVWLGFVLPFVLFAAFTYAAGLQAAFRFSEGPHAGGQAGQVVALSSRETVRAEAAVPYVHHSSEGTDVRSPELATWAFAWTAPPREDPVAFYIAANSANGDNSPFGDLVYTAGEIIAGVAP